MFDQWGRSSNRARRTITIDVLAAYAPYEDDRLFSPVGGRASVRTTSGAPFGLTVRLEAAVHPFWGPYIGTGIGLSITALGFDASAPVPVDLAPRPRPR